MKWQPTPVSLPGKSHGRRNLVGPSSWGPKELDMTEQLHFHLQKGPAAGTAEMNSKHYWLSRSQFQRSIFSHPLGKEIKKKKKKNPDHHRTRCTVNYYQSDADQKDKKWNPARMAILTVCKQYMKKSPGRWWTPPPSCSLGTDIGNNPLKGQPVQARTKRVNRAKPRILIPTPGPTLQKTIIQNDTWTPTFTAVVPPTAKMQP